MAAGHPPRYRSAKEISRVIDQYFATHGSLTVGGLVNALKFGDRQSLYDYGKRGEFSCIIKEAIGRIAENVEERMLKGEGYGPGLIFWLKNHGWSDRQEIEHSGTQTVNNILRYPLPVDIGAPVPVVDPNPQTSHTP